MAPSTAPLNWRRLLNLKPDEPAGAVDLARGLVRVVAVNPDADEHDLPAEIRPPPWTPGARAAKAIVCLMFGTLIGLALIAILTRQAGVAVALIAPLIPLVWWVIDPRMLTALLSRRERRP